MAATKPSCLMVSAFAVASEPAAPETGTPGSTNSPVRALFTRDAWKQFLSRTNVRTFAAAAEVAAPAFWEHRQEAESRARRRRRFLPGLGCFFPEVRRFSRAVPYSVPSRPKRLRWNRLPIHAAPRAN